MGKILLIKTGAFGDIILTSISIEIAAKSFPGYQIYFLTSQQYAEIYKNCPFIKKIFSLSPQKKITEFLRLTKKLRKERFEIIFDLQGNLKTNFFCFLFGGKRRIGFYKKKLGKLFLTKGIKKKHTLNPVQSQIFFWQKFLKREVNGNLHLWIDENRHKNFLLQHSLKQKNYVVFHPSASKEWKTKLWITDYWVNLGKFFIEKNFKIVLVGDKNSLNLNTEIAKCLKINTINLSGKTNFSELAFLIKNSKMVITTDSGPMHLAAAAGVKTLAIFGPTNPAFHCPPGIKAINSQIDCIFCYKKYCQHHSCMKIVSPDKIITFLKFENNEKNT